MWFLKTRVEKFRPVCEQSVHDCHKRVTIFMGRVKLPDSVPLNNGKQAEAHEGATQFHVGVFLLVKHTKQIQTFSFVGFIQRDFVWNDISLLFYIDG